MKTARITSDSIVDMIFHLKWKSELATHTDAYQANRVNIWRDLLPQSFMPTLMGKTSGDRLQLQWPESGASAIFTPEEPRTIDTRQFDPGNSRGASFKPHLGRFYPKGILKGVSGIFSTNVQPFRCVGLNNGHVTVDFNHPLAGKLLDISAVVGRISPKTSERGGTSVDWLEVLTSGPGMQARWQAVKTDYFFDGAFFREDDRPDGEFYRHPRYVHHLDATAREMVSNTYERFIKDGMRVLDLMGSWRSHIPAHIATAEVAGLGLNAKELASNTRLDNWRVHDLNIDPTLPYISESFDVVINTASVEYLTDPLAVFREVNRVLRPGGRFVVTFSNRWFPPKAISLWKELHEFERMGLVLEYFLESDGFEDLQTYSIRGLPRPHDDKYYPEQITSDPVYAVWGTRR